MKFVIVEDEIRIREGILRLLPKLDKENEIVGEAENGLEGLEIIRKEKPDVIITDIRMPLMDGLDMLEKLHEEGCDAKAIVLSAYSEFEYARQAIRLGVTEYLLKPIVIGDFSDAVERVKKEWEKDRRRKPDQIGTLDQMFINILNGDLKLEAEVVTYLKRQLGVSDDRPISLMTMYFEEWDKQKVMQSARNLRMILAEKPSPSYCLLENERQKELNLILYDDTDHHRVKRQIQNYFLRKNDHVDNIAMGWTQAENIYMLKTGYENLELYLEWNISLGDEVIISYPEIKHIKTVLCVYPIEIENQIKIAICTNNLRAQEKSIQRFHDYFQNKKIYEPKKIKECYVRFFWAVINFSKEVGNLDYENFEQQSLLEKIMSNKTMQGLKQAASELMLKIKKQNEDIENINVRRAVAIIHEFYRTGITLDEIAVKLGITPEYLGTQFHQEMGVNFSAYIKKYRMNKAKELLLGTQLKLYEIAEMVGYSDAKYFSRVFKAETGQLPAEYRKTHK